MLQRDNVPVNPRRFSLIQHPFAPDISLSRRYRSKSKPNPGRAEGRGLCVALAPREPTHATPTPRERTSSSPLPKSTRRICFKLTASRSCPKHARTHTANTLTPLQSFPRNSLSLAPRGLADALSIPASITRKLPPAPHSTSCPSAHGLLFLASRRWEANTTWKSDPPVPMVSSHFDRPVVMSAQRHQPEEALLGASFITYPSPRPEMLTCLQTDTTQV